MKKSESESESELRKTKNHLNQVQIEVNNLIQMVSDLRDEMRAVQRVLLHAQHTNTDDGSRHQNDGGWFD